MPSVVVPSHCVKPDEYLFICRWGRYLHGESMGQSYADEFVRAKPGPPLRGNLQSSCRLVHGIGINTAIIPRWGNAIQMYNELLNEYGFEQVFGRFPAGNKPLLTIA